MDFSDRWKIRKELGEGGQGKVYLVSKKLGEIGIQNQIIQTIASFSGISTDEKRKEKFEVFRNAIIKMLELENASQQNALKVLHLPKDARDPDLAIERIKREIKVIATSQFGCPWLQFNRPWKSHNNRQRKRHQKQDLQMAA